jgi:hypothetical protein
LATAKHYIPSYATAVAAKIDAVPEMGIRHVIVGNRIVVGGHGAIGHNRYSTLDIGHEIGGYGHVAGIEDENPRTRASRGVTVKVVVSHGIILDFSRGSKPHLYAILGGRRGSCPNHRVT